MVKLELDQVVMRRMREDDIETVKAIIKSCQGTENRLILHILTRPVCLLLLFTMPRSTGVLGTSRPYWDYVGSSYRGAQDETLPNPYSRISGKPPPAKARRRTKPKAEDKDKDSSPEIVDVEWEKAIVGCVSREGDCRLGMRRFCRGLGRLLVQSLEQRERQTGARRVYAHVPYPSAVGEAFFRKLGYRLQGEVGYDGEEKEEDEEQPERTFLGFHVTKVFVKDLK
uniref:Probable N-acetyltransferase 14 n=1 Tax=Oncorhynchus kisutch TaxID=8019 RepID=A0A8C7GFN9_ONCKI